MPKGYNGQSPLICKQIWVFLTHLKLWVAVLRHNFKWVKSHLNNIKGNLCLPMPQAKQVLCKNKAVLKTQPLKLKKKV